jgi:methyltransferase-like protein
LGCGDGTNLISMSWALPASEFVGIDLAAEPIAAGLQMLDGLAINNVRLVNGSITDIDESWGAFDYIIAHGFYSWVPAAVRDHMMLVCRKCLAPQGVAFVSYNAYPGSHMRQMLREMLRFHVRDVASPSERTRQATAFLSLLASAQSEASPGNWILPELQRTMQHTDALLYHDDMAEVNEPRYFVQFMEHATAFGLKYVGEADYFEMSDHTFPQHVREILDRVRSNRIVHEQYLDFLKGRRFRQTLLCQTEAPLLTEPDGAVIADYLISSSAVLKQTAGKEENTTVYETAKGARVETDYAAGLSALEVLQLRWPRPIPFSELVQDVAARLRAKDVALPGDREFGDELAGFLLSVYSAGVVDFRTHAPNVALRAGERPLASPVARWQAEHADAVTAVNHVTVQLGDDVARRLMQLLDGTRDRELLRGELRQLLKARGAFPPELSEEASGELVAVELEKNLQKLAELGLLVG